MGIMEKKRETTIMGYIGLGLYRIQRVLKGYRGL